MKIEQPTRESSANHHLPLVVDLDGTLIKEDLTALSFRHYFAHPAIGWRMCLIAHQLLFKGWAATKAFVATRTTLSIPSCHWHAGVLQWIKQARTNQRRVLLATGTHEIYAAAVCNHLGCFDDFFASNKDLVLVGKHKRDLLIERFGERGYDYVGNSHQDLPVWQTSRFSFVVNAPASILKKALDCAVVMGTLPAQFIRQPMDHNQPSS